MSKNTGNLHLTTSLRNGGRKAGYGMYEDDYSDESSGQGHYTPWKPVRFPNDDVTPESLNGECVIIQKGKIKED